MALKKYQKFLLYAVPAAIAGYLIYRQIRKGTQKQTAVQPPESTPSVTQPPTSSSNSNNCSYPLTKNFVVCDNVKDIQFYLNNIFSYAQIVQIQSWWAAEGDWQDFTNKDGVRVGCENNCNLKPLATDGKLGDKTIGLWNDTMFSKNPKTSFTQADFDDLKKFYEKCYRWQLAMDNKSIVSTDPSPTNPAPNSIKYKQQNPLTTISPF